MGIALDDSKSNLFPTSAIIMFGLACRWSSLTQDLALSRDAYNKIDRNMSTIKSFSFWKVGQLQNQNDDDK